MYDLRLAKMLLAPSQPTVALVGEPVFRLSEALDQESGHLDYAGDAPVVAKFECVERFIDACQAGKFETAHCVMCLHLPANTADFDHLLGLACRAAPRLLVVEHAAGETTASLLADERFFAFGFRRLEKISAAGRQTALYAYSLSDYKQAPAWLNARFWAHPERFGGLE